MKKQSQKWYKKTWVYIVGTILLIGLITVIAYLFGKDKKENSGSSSDKGGFFKDARGWRNKNPLNIRIGNDWVGEAKSVTDEKNYEVFTHFKYGYRAAFKILTTYKNKYKINTLLKVIEKWTPVGNGNNNPLNYVDSVTKYMAKDGFIVDKNTIIKLDNNKFMISLLKAMTIVECGSKYENKININDIQEGINLA